MANLVSVEAANLLQVSSNFQVTVASVTTTSASTSATVASGGFPGVSVGMYVLGTGIVAGTVVSGISSNTLTLSIAAYASGTVTLTFTYPPPVGPVQVALMTANGSNTTAGTEVTNAGGSTYARQNVTFAAATSSSSGGSISSNAALSFTNMPATTVVGVEEWDSASTKVRRWFGSLSASKTTNLGDTLSIASGSYTKTLQ